MVENVPENALFVCFGAMSNVGMLSGLAALEAVKQVKPGKAGIFAWIGAGIVWVLNLSQLNQSDA